MVQFKLKPIFPCCILKIHWSLAPSAMTIKPGCGLHPEMDPHVPWLCYIDRVVLQRDTEESKQAWDE